MAARPGRWPRSSATTVGSERSGLFAYLNTNKRSVELDVTSPTGAHTLHEIIETADAVIDDHDESWAREVQQRHPDVVFCSLTPYGQGVPPELQHAKSINVFHSSGWGYHTPTDADPAKPPLKGPGRFLADYDSALDAALCVVSSLFWRLHTGQGQFIDVSQQAVLVSRADCILGRFISGEIAPENNRHDYDQQGPASFFECADGFVYLYMTSGRHWAGVEAVDGASGLARVLRGRLAGVQRHTGEGRRGSGGASPSGCATAARMRSPNERNSFQWHSSRSTTRRPCNGHRSTATADSSNDVTHPVLGTAWYPTVPYKLSASPARIDSPAPSLGQHTAGGGR